MNDVVEMDEDFGVPSKSKYEFNKLKVGQALKFTDLTKYPALRSAASRQGDALKKKFSVRKVKEEDLKTHKLVPKIVVVRIK